MYNELDIRCPVAFGRLFFKIRSEGQKPQYVDNGMLLEVSCSDCTKELRRNGSKVTRVLHRYNVKGDIIETEIIKD